MKQNQKWLMLSALLIVACIFAGCMPAMRTSSYENADEYFGNRIDSCGSILLAYGYYERADNQGACV